MANLHVQLGLQAGSSNHEFAFAPSIEYYIRQPHTNHQSKIHWREVIASMESVTEKSTVHLFFSGFGTSALPSKNPRCRCRRRFVGFCGHHPDALEHARLCSSNSAPRGRTWGNHSGGSVCEYPRLLLDVFLGLVPPVQPFSTPRRALIGRGCGPIRGDSWRHKPNCGMFCTI